MDERIDETTGSRRMRMPSWSAHLSEFELHGAKRKLGRRGAPRLYSDILGSRRVDETAPETATPKVAEPPVPGPVATTAPAAETSASDGGRHLRIVAPELTPDRSPPRTIGRLIAQTALIAESAMNMARERRPNADRSGRFGRF